MKFNTGMILVTKIDKNNLDKAMDVYAAKLAEMEPELDTHIETLAIGTTITNSLLGAGTIYEATKGQYYATIDGKIIYYRMLNQIQEHTADSTRVVVTVGPKIQWSFDQNLSTYEESEIGGSYNIALTKDNLSDAQYLYAEAEFNLRDYVGTYINSLTLGSVIDAGSIGASSTRTIVGNKSGKTYYFRPTYLIPAHRSDSRSVTITIYSSINFGETSDLGRNYDIGSKYEATITITPQNISQMATLYTEKVDLMRDALNNHITSLAMGRTITEADLGLSKVFSAVQTISGESIYFKSVYNLPTHTKWDISLSITLGPTINYGTSTNSLNQSYNAGNSYKYTIDFDKDNLNHQLSIVENRLGILKDRFEEYLRSTVLGVIVTSTILETDTVHHCTVYDKVYYFKASSYNIPGHRTDDRSVTIDIGKDVIYSENENLSGTKVYSTNGTSAISITRSNLNSANNVYYNAVELLGRQLAAYIESTKLGTTINSAKLRAETVRSFVTSINNRKIYYKVAYTIPGHSSGDNSVTVTQGSRVLYGPAENNLAYVFESGIVYKLEFTRQNVASCGDIYTNNLPKFQQALDNYFNSRILGTKVTANMLGAGTIRDLVVLNRHVYYQAEWDIPNHSETDEKVTITVGPVIKYDLVANTLNYSYNVGTNNAQLLSVTVDNINDLSNDYKAKCEILRDMLIQYLSTKLGTLVISNPFYTSSYQREDQYYKIVPTVVYYNINVVNKTEFGSDDVYGMFDISVLCGRTATAINIDTGKKRTISASINNYEAVVNNNIAELENEIKNEIFKYLLYDIKCNDTEVNPGLAVNYTYTLHNPENTVSKSYYVAINATVSSNWYTVGARIRVKTTYGVSSGNRTRTNFLENDINVTADENGSPEQAIQTIVAEKARQFGKIKEYFDTFIGPIDSADYAYQYDSEVTGLTFFIRVQYAPEKKFEPYTSQTAVVECEMTWGTESLDGPFNHRGSKFTVTITNYTYDQYIQAIIDAANSQKLENDVLDKVIGPIATTSGSGGDSAPPATGGIIVVIDEIEDDPLTLEVKGYSNKLILGQSTNITLSSSGGYGEKTYTCNNTDEVVFTSSTTLRYTPTELGSHILSFTVMDQERRKVSASISITVEQETRVVEEEFTNDAGVTYYYQTTYKPSQEYVPYESEEVELEIEVKYGTEPGHYDQVVSQSVAKVDTSNYRTFTVQPQILPVEEIAQQQEQAVTKTTVEQQIIQQQETVAKAIGEIEIVDRNDVIETVAGIQLYSKTVTAIDPYNPYTDETTTVISMTEWGYIVDNKTYVVGTLENLETIIDATNYANYNEVVEFAIETQKRKLENYLDTLLGPMEIATETEKYTSPVTNLDYYIETTYHCDDDFAAYFSTEANIYITVKWGITGLTGPFDQTGENSVVNIINTNYATYETTATNKAEEIRVQLRAYLDTLLGPISKATEQIPYTTKSTKILYYIKTTFTTNSNFTPYSSTTASVTTTTSYGTDANDANTYYTSNVNTITKDNYSYIDNTTQKRIGYNDALESRKVQQVEDCKKYLERLLGDLVYNDVTKTYSSPLTGIRYFEKTTFIPGPFNKETDDTISITVTTYWGSTSENRNTMYTSSIETIQVANYADDLSAVLAVGELQRNSMEEYLAPLLGPLDLSKPSDIAPYISKTTALEYYIRTITSSSYEAYTGSNATIYISSLWDTVKDTYSHSYTDFSDQFKTVNVVPATYKNSDYKTEQNSHIQKQRELLEAYLDTLLGPLTASDPVTESVNSVVKENLTFYIQTIFTLPEDYTSSTVSTADISVKTYWSTDPEDISTYFNYNDNDPNTYDDKIIANINNYQLSKYKTIWVKTVGDGQNLEEKIITDPTELENLKKIGDAIEKDVEDDSYVSYMKAMLNLGILQREACKAYLKELIFPEDIYEEYTTTTTNKLYYIKTINTVKDTDNFYPDKTNLVNITTSYSATPGLYDRTSYTPKGSSTVNMVLDKARTEGDLGETYVTNINGEGENQRDKLHQYLNSIIGPIDIAGYNESYTSPVTGLEYDVLLTATPPEDFDPFGDTETTITIQSQWKYPGGDLTDYNSLEFPLRVRINIGEENEEFTYDNDMATITNALAEQYKNLKEYLDTLIGDVTVSEYIEEYTSPRTNLTFNIQVVHSHSTSYVPYSGEASVDIDLEGFWSLQNSQKFPYICDITEHYVVDEDGNKKNTHDYFTVTADNYINYPSLVEAKREELLVCLRAYLDTVVGFLNTEKIDEIYTAITDIKYHIVVEKTSDDVINNSAANVNIISDWTTVDGVASAEFERKNLIIASENFLNSGPIISEEMQGQYTRLKAYLDSLFGVINTDEHPIEYTNDVNMQFYINTYIRTEDYTPYTSVDGDYGVLVTVNTYWSTNENEYTEFFECVYDDTYYVVSLVNFSVSEAVILEMVQRQQEALMAYLNTLAGPPFSDTFKETYTSPVTKKTYYIITYYDRDSTFFRKGVSVDETIHTKWDRFENTYNQDWQTEVYTIDDNTLDTYEAIVDNIGLVQRDELKRYLDSLIDTLDIEPAQIESDYYTNPLNLHLFVRVSYNISTSSDTQVNIAFLTQWSLDYDTKYRNTYEDCITELVITAENFDNAQEKIDEIVESNTLKLQQLADTFIGPLPELAAADGLTYVNLVTGVTWNYLKSYTVTEYNYLDGYTGDVDIFGTYGLGCQGVETTIPDRFEKEKEFLLTVQNYGETFTSTYNRTLISFSKNQEEIGRLLGPVTIPEEEFEDFVIRDGRHVYAKTMYLFDETLETYEEFMTHGVFYDETVTIVCVTLYGFQEDSYENMFLTERYEIKAENYKVKNTDLYNIYLDHMEKLKKMFQMWDIYVDDYDTEFTNMGGLTYIIRSRFIQLDQSYAANSIAYKTSYCLKDKDYEDIIYDISQYIVTLDTFVSVEQSNTELKLLEDAKVEELKNLLDKPNILPIMTDNLIYEASNGMKFVLRVRFTRNPEGINMVDCAYYIDGEQYGPTLTRVYHRTEEEAIEDMEFIQEQGLDEMKKLCDSNIPEDVDIIYPEESNFQYHVKLNYEKIAGDTAISIFATFDSLTYTAKKCYVRGNTFVTDMEACRNTAVATLNELKKEIDDTTPISEKNIYSKGKSRFGVNVVYTKKPDDVEIKCNIKCDNEQIKDESTNMDSIKNLENIIGALTERIEIVRNDIISYIKEIYPDTGYDSLQKNGFKYAMNTEYVKEEYSHDVTIVVKLDNTEYSTHKSHFDYKDTKSQDIIEMNDYYSKSKDELIALIAISNPDKEQLYMFDNVLYNIETNYKKEENESEVNIITRLDSYIFRLKTSPLTVTDLVNNMNEAKAIAEADYADLEEIINITPYNSYNDLRVIDNFEYKCGASYYKLSNQQEILVNILLDENIMEQYTDLITAENAEEDIRNMKNKAGIKIYDLLQTCRGILDEEKTYKNDNMEFTLDVIYKRTYPNKNFIYISSLVEGIQYQEEIKESFYLNKIDDYRVMGQTQLQILKDLIDSLPRDTEEVYIVNGFGFNISTHYLKYKHTNYITITVKLDGVKVKEAKVTFNPNTTIDIENKADQLVNEVKISLNTCPADFEEVYTPDDSHFTFLIGGKYSKRAGDITVYLYNTLDYDIVEDQTRNVKFNINKINTLKVDLSWLKSQLDQSPYNNTEDYHITRPNNKVDCHFYISREYSKVAGNKEVRTSILLDGELYGNMDIRDYNVNYPTETEDYANLAVGDLKDKLDTIILSDINTAYKKYGFDFNIEVYFTKSAGAKDVTVSYRIEKRKQLNYGDISEIETIDI